MESSEKAAVRISALLSLCKGTLARVKQQRSPEVLQGNEDRGRVPVSCEAGGGLPQKPALPGTLPTSLGCLPHAPGCLSCAPTVAAAVLV